jgi:hypothetical protein
MYLPHICGDPIIELSFQLNSNKIEIDLHPKRIYNIKNVQIISENGDWIRLLCTESSLISIYSDFKLIQNIYYYPFISSKFILNIKINSIYKPYLEISIPDEFKSLTFLSYIKDKDSNKLKRKEKETWINNKGIFHIPFFINNEFLFTLRTTGRSINFGILHIILPLLILMVGFLFKVGNLPGEVIKNASSILFAILLTLTPFYIGILQNFIAKSFMSVNLGIYLYFISYLLAIIFVICFMLYPSYIIFPTILIIIWFILFLSSIKGYFNTGKFNRIIDFILYRPVIYLIRKRYSTAWKKQKNKNIQ